VDDVKADAAVPFSHSDRAILEKLALFRQQRAAEREAQHDPNAG
jgi:gentisate 1,2-dioxygenase